MFEQVGLIRDIQTHSNDESTLQSEVVNLLLNGRHQDKYKPHILGICKFVQDHELNGIHKLKLLHLGFSFLQNLQ